jgi:hypothetical protein
VKEFVELVVELFCSLPPPQADKNNIKLVADIGKK